MGEYVQYCWLVDVAGGVQVGIVVVETYGGKISDGSADIVQTMLGDVYAVGRSQWTFFSSLGGSGGREIDGTKGLDGVGWCDDAG